MTLEVHLFAYNEAHMIGYALRHWATLGAEVVVHDAFSNDGTREIAGDAGAKVVDWDTGGQVNDLLLKRAKSECWHGTKAFWVAVVDADELLWPCDGVGAFHEWDVRAVAVVRPHGWEMTAEKFPTRPGQIYEQVKDGAPDDYWFSKPVLFSPRRVRAMEFGAGAHDATVEYADGRRERFTRDEPFTYPPCYLLHFHHVGPVAWIAARYDEHIARSAPINRRMRWGDFRPGLETATEKRHEILARLERVLP
jgi:glycosyltransferase involved in cell wall biosynthesis